MQLRLNLHVNIVLLVSISFLIIIVGPLPPLHLQSTFINSSTIVVNWSPNLLWDTYPIAYYNIIVVAKGARNDTFTFISTTVEVQSKIHKFIYIK